MSAVEAVLLGAGQRGTDSAGGFARRHPDELKFIAVAEPDEGRRARFASQHNIPSERSFSSYEELLNKPQLAPLCFNTTMDPDHLPSSLRALEKGYHLFLEKPMANTADGCLKIARKAGQKNLMVQICHPLRFTPFYLKVKELIQDGAIGEIVSFSMSENVCYWHYAHSFVRGNWRRQETSGPFILTKCCHDMDLAIWFAECHVSKVASFGERSFFTEENAPKGAPERCTDGCPVEKTCPFYAPALYLGDVTEWPVSAISLDSSLEARRHALETGPYGRCVFKCDNTITDHQVVSAVFEDGVTFNFAVRANTFHPYRTVRILGTEGELNGHFEKSEISVMRFAPGFGIGQKPDIYTTTPLDGAHGGGDTGAIRNFLRCFQKNDFSSIQHSLELAVEGHLLAFASEQSRLSGKIVDMNRFKDTYTT